VSLIGLTVNLTSQDDECAVDESAASSSGGGVVEVPKPPRRGNLAKRSVSAKAASEALRVLFSDDEIAFVNKHGFRMRSRNISPRAADSWIGPIQLPGASVLHPKHANPKSCSDLWRRLHPDL